MVFGSIFIIIAVGILAFAYITSVFGREVVQNSLDEDQAAAAVSGQVYQQKLQWLKELEAEYETGKIESKDYLRQQSILQADALEALTKMKAVSSLNLEKENKAVEVMIHDRRMERVERSAGFCVKCGKPLQRSDQFCPHCGSRRT
jgi:rubrerythrin